MFVHSLMKHYTAIEYVTSEGQYHTKLERYCTQFKHVDISYQSSVEILCNTIPTEKINIKHVI